MKKKKINLIVFCMAVVCAVSFCLAIFLSFPRGEKTAVAESRNITVIDARQAEEMLQFEDDAKTILVGTVSDARWTTGGDLHLVIPKSVVTIKPGAGLTEGFTLSARRIVSISFENGSRFKEITGCSSSLPWFGGNGTSLKSITFPANGLHQTIGDYAFYGNYLQAAISSGGLQSVEFTTDGSITIGANAFNNCSGLRTFDCKVTASATAVASVIGTNAFKGASKLYRAVFPSNLVTVGASAFEGCTMLFDVALGDAVTEISSAAFKDTGLVRFTIPAALKEMGNEAFASSFKLAEIENHTSVDYSAHFRYALHYYKKGVGVSNMVRDENGFVFCKNTMRTGSLTDKVNYVKNEWYLVGFADPIEHRWADSDDGTSVKKLFEFPESVSDATQRWNTVYTTGIYGKLVIDGDDITLSSRDEWADGKSYDYIDSNGNPVVNGISDTITQYSIGASAFQGLWAPYLKLSDAIVYVGNEAFSWSRISSVVLGENLKGIGSNAFFSFNASNFDGCPFSTTVYMPSGKKTIDCGIAAFKGYSTGSNTVRFIYRNRADYESNSGNRLTYTNATGEVIYTYLLPVTFHALDNSEEQRLIGSVTAEKVAGMGYGYSKDPQTNIWVENEKEKTLPNVNDIDGVGNIYKSTNWFKANADGSNKFNEPADFAKIDGGVKNALGGSAAKLEYYAKKVDIPVLSPFEATFDESKNYTFSQVTGLNVTKDGDFTVKAVYSDTLGGEPQETDAVTGTLHRAGTYAITVSLNEKWGVWAGESTSVQTTAKISRAEVTLSSESRSLVWGVVSTTIDGATVQENQSLRSGSLYVQGSKVYLEPQYEGHAPTKVSESYARYRQNRLVTVGVQQSTAASKLYEISAYTGRVTAEEEGVYDATAVLRLINENDYEFKAAGYDAEYGVRVTLTNGSTASVTKTWYIVGVTNWLIPGDATPDDNAPEFVFSEYDSWVYGSDITFDTPKLRHGDQSAIKFTLSRNGVILSGADGASVVDGSGNDVFQTYLNGSMPAGEYVLKIAVDSISEEGATYPAIERTYGFTVTPREYTAEQISAITSALAGVFEYKYDTSLLPQNQPVHIWDGGYDALKDKDGRNQAQFDALNALLADQSWVVARNGVWAQTAYDGLYGGFSLSYNLYRMQSNEYKNESYFATSSYLREVGEYTVYYQFSAPSYRQLVNASDDGDKNAHRFTVVIYRELTVPEISTENLYYTGSRVTPAVTGNDFYSVAWDADDDYTTARVADGEEFKPVGHKIILHSLNANLYRWQAGSDGIDPANAANYIFTYEIKPARNGWTTSPRIAPWTWNSFSAQSNVMTAVPAYGVDTVAFTIYKHEPGGYVKITEPFTLERDEGGNPVMPQSVAEILAAQSAGNYRLTASVPTGANYEGISDGEQSFEFSVTPASNGWAVTPNVVYWSWSGYDKTVNKIMATPRYTVEGNSVKFAVFAEDGTTLLIDEFTLGADGLVDDGVAEKFAALDRGVYYLRSGYDGAENFNEIKPSFFRFEVLQANNSWTASPSITGWQYQGFSASVNFVAGVPQYSGEGAVVSYGLFTEMPKSGETPADGKYFNDIAEVEEYLNGLNCGTYWLLASFDGTNNYKALSARISFRVTQATANPWLSAPYLSDFVYGSHDFTLTAGNATFGTPVYSVSKRNPSNPNSYDPVAGKTGLAFDGLAAALKPLGAGDYKLTVTAADTANAGNENYIAAESEIIFKVLKAENGWQITPSIADADGWTYGDAAKTVTAGVALHENPAVVGKYFAVRQSGASWIKVGEGFDEQPVNAGNYLYETTAAATDNYNAVTHAIYFGISQFANGWASEPKSSYGWTYDGTVDITTLENAAAKKGEIKLTLDGKTVSISDIRALHSGSYNLEITVQGDENYTGLAKTVLITVNRAAFAWATRPAATAQWVYGSTEKPFTVPAVTKSGANYSFTVNYTSADNKTQEEKSFSSGDALKTYLLTERRGAGVYLVSVTVSADDYNDLSGMTVLTVDRADNGWVKSPDEINWTYGAADNPAIEFIPQTGAPVYTLDGEPVTLSALAGKNAGKYTLRAAVAETNDYNQLVKSVSLNIEKAENGFKTPLSVSGWQWNDYSPLAQEILTLPVLSHKTTGDTVTVTVLDADGATVITQNLVCGADGELVGTAALLNELAKLNSGEYTVKAVVVESVNYLAAEQTPSAFEVTAVGNEWLTSLSISGWEYGREPNSPVAVAKHGNDKLTFTYYRVTDDGETEVTSFGVAGRYKVVASVPKTGNYAPLTATAEFTVERAENTNWQEHPNASGWFWNGFDHNTNLFYAQAKSGGEISYTVYNGTEEIKFTSDSQGRVTEEGARNKLNALVAGSYRYKVNVAQTENYKAFEATFSFTVTQAVNEWTKFPSVVAWSVNDRDKNDPGQTPTAAAKYGDATITFISKDDGKTYYSAKYIAATGETKLLSDNILDATPAGWYSFGVTVAGESGKYNGMTFEQSVQVFKGSTNRPANTWEVVPAIGNWLAGEGDGVEPVGNGVRYTSVEYTYWTVIIENGKYTRGELLDGKPEAPGEYMLHVKSVFGDYTEDTLEADVPFRIIPRPNKWSVAPNLNDWSLGGAASVPVAETLIKGTITYEFKKRELNDSYYQPFTSGCITEQGEYTLKVTAKAEWCEDLVAYIDFKVSLSVNQWLDIPVIQDWSEEFAPNAPAGKAMYGEVVYTYATADGVMLDSKPTTEGSYIMYATVTLDGFETLHAEYAFTITPAYDALLLTVDTVLASILCVLAVVVIIFAVRRYREC